MEYTFVTVFLIHRVKHGIVCYNNAPILVCIGDVCVLWLFSCVKFETVRFVR